VASNSAFNCLFRFWPIALKQLNSLTTIDTFSLPSGLEITNRTGVRRSPVWFLALTRFFMLRNFVIPFCNVSLFSTLHILLHLWPIIRVSRYRHRIFNIWTYFDNVFYINYSSITNGGVPSPLWPFDPIHV